MADVIVSGGGVYCIRNTKNGKCYVGSSISFKTRWKRHRSQLRAGTHHSEKLQRSWQKHGESVFEFAVLEHVSDPSSLVDTEQAWIEKLNAFKGGYNSSPTAGSVLGIKHSDSMREKMRAIRAANPITPEQHEKMAEARRNSAKFIDGTSKLGKSRVGYKHTDEAKAKISEASKRSGADQSIQAAKREAMVGFKHSQETIEKLRLIPRRSGWKHTPEALEKIRLAGIGRKISDETIAKRKETREKNRKARNESE